MKTLLLTAALAISALSAPAAAKPYYVVGPPTMIMKYGVWPESDAEDNAGKTNALTVELESGKCKRYSLCYNPYFVHIDNDAGKNSGFGFNVKHYMAKRYHVETNSSDAFYVEAGPVVFEDVLNDNTGEQHTTSHIGVGIQVRSAVISFDTYGIEQDVPSFLINVGVHF